MLPAAASPLLEQARAPVLEFQPKVLASQQTVLASQPTVLASQPPALEFQPKPLARQALPQAVSPPLFPGPAQRHQKRPPAAAAGCRSWRAGRR